MKTTNCTEPAAQQASHKLTTTSADGKWETFHKHAGLRRYTSNGVFHACLKVNGKLVWESLKTNVKSVALDKLALKRQKLRKPAAEVGTVADGYAKFETATNSNSDLKPTSKTYNMRCLDRIKRSWPELGAMSADRITEDQMKDWANRYKDLYAPQFFNNSLNVLREILTLAGLHRDDNPAWKVERRGIPRHELNLPTAEQFEKLVHEVEHSGAGQSKSAAALVRFLAYSGARISEAKLAKWGDVNWDKNHLALICAKRRVDSRELPTRKVPLVPAMQAFLKAEQTKAAEVGRELKPETAICRVFECQKSLTRACKVVGCARLTHHSLRHLFATFCIEAGVDIPTVSRWLGHSDGGALAMRIYGHLREEHS